MVDDEAGTWAVVDPCPFYPTGGGQVSDVGCLTRGGERWPVLECARVTDALTVVRLPAGTPLAAGDRVTAAVDAALRRRTAAHHTTTHLLHAALRQHLHAPGRVVQQAGSLVSHDRFRFDFSWPAPVPPDTLRMVEAAVNEAASAALPVTQAEVPRAQAEAEGAVGLFADKYGDVVRVVRVGDVSAELCGGTHASNSLECYPFVVLSESSVSAGTRRIEGVSGQAAVQLLQQGWEALRQICGGAVKVSPADAVKGVQRVKEELELQREAVKQLRRQLVGKKDWKAATVAFPSSRGVQAVVVHAVPVGDAGGLGELKADALALAQRGEAAAHVLLCAENGLCVVSGRAPVVEEVWGRLTKGLVGKGGKGGGSGGLMQGRLPSNEEGGVDTADVLRLLSAPDTAHTLPTTSQSPSSTSSFSTLHARAGS